MTNVIYGASNLARLFQHTPIYIYPSKNDASELIGAGAQSRRPRDERTNETVGDVILITNTDPTSFSVISHDVSRQNFLLSGNQTKFLKGGDSVIVGNCSHSAALVVSEIYYNSGQDVTELSYESGGDPHSGGSSVSNCTAIDSIAGNDTYSVLLGGGPGAHCDDEAGRSGYRDFQFGPGTIITKTYHYAIYIAYGSGLDGVENLRALYKGRMTSGRHEYIDRGHVDPRIPEHLARLADRLSHVDIYLLLRAQDNSQRGTEYPAVIFPNSRGVLQSCDSQDAASSACPRLTDGITLNQTGPRRTLRKSIFLRNHAQN